MLIFVAMIAFFLPVSSFSAVRIRDAYLLKLTAWQLVTRIRQAKIEALESGKEIRLFFDTSGNRVLYRGKSGKTEIVNFPKGVILYTTNFPSNALFFRATGVPSSGGTVTVRLGTQRRYIIVTPVTGRVRFSEKPPS